MSTELEEFVSLVGSGERISSGSPANNPWIEKQGGSSQWMVKGQGKYAGSPQTVKSLPEGVYTCSVDPHTGQVMLLVSKQSTDKLIDLDDTASSDMLASLGKFWESEARYRQAGLLYKRGYLLWGPPGSGKTVTIELAIQKMIEKNGGIALITSCPAVSIEALSIIRSIEPDRPIINVMEDIDTIITKYGESDLLSLLDGESQIDKVVHIATVNYPAVLDPRITNRPSRFDEIIKVALPTKESRLKYLTTVSATIDGMTVEDIADDTDGFSIAHLRELIAACAVMDAPYGPTVKRLRTLRPSKRSPGFGKGND